MIKNIIQKLSVKTDSNKLTDLDELYRKTIVDLPYEARIHYCNNLIENCLLDLNIIKKKKKIRRINKLIKAAKHEIDRLSKKSYAHIAKAP